MDKIIETPVSILQYSSTAPHSRDSKIIKINESINMCIKQFQEKLSNIAFRKVGFKLETECRYFHSPRQTC